MPEYLPLYSLGEAIQRLQPIGDFGWLIDGPDYVAAKEVADHLRAMGIGGSKDTVTRWFKQLPSTVMFGEFGLRAKRAEVLQLLAEKFTAVNAMDADQQIG